MGLKLVNYKYCGLPAPDAYARVEYPGSLKNPVIGVGYYASHEARQAGETALAFVQFTVPEPVPVNPPVVVDPEFGKPIPDANDPGFAIPTQEINDPGFVADQPIEMTPGPAQWFSEAALKTEGMTAAVASYEFLKTLPEFTGAVDAQ